jgi:hypothetical protein
MVTENMKPGWWHNISPSHDFEVEIHSVDATRTVAAMPASTPEIRAAAIHFDIPLPPLEIVIILLVQK